MGKYALQKKELMKIFSLVGIGVFSGMIVIDIREYLTQFGSPFVIGATGLIIFAYIFNIN